MGIGNRIKEARLNLGYTQEELAKLLGVTKGAVANYEIETSHPKEPIMYKLIEILQVDANYLFQDCVKLPKEVNDVTLAEYNHVKKYRSLDPNGQEIVSYILNKEAERVKELTELKKNIPTVNIETPEEHTLVRFISYHQRLASAGTGQVVFEDMPVDRIEIPDIPKYKRVSYAIGVNGQSMEPLYSDGDILLIEPTCQVEIGEIGIFIVDGEAFVKKLGDGELISLNKDHKNIPLTEYSNCMGRVVDKLHQETKKMNDQ